MTSLLLLATLFLIQARGHWLLGHQGTLLAHGQSAADQHPQVPFCLGTVQPHHPQPVMLLGVTVAKMQILHLDLLNSSYWTSSY